MAAIAQRRRTYFENVRVREVENAGNGIFIKQLIIVGFFTSLILVGIFPYAQLMHYQRVIVSLQQQIQKETENNKNFRYKYESINAKEQIMKTAKEKLFMRQPAEAEVSYLEAGKFVDKKPIAVKEKKNFLISLLHRR